MVYQSQLFFVRDHARPLLIREAVQYADEPHLSINRRT